MRPQPVLSLKQIRAINAVAQTHGFGQAAEALNTTQSVVSRAVASAEAELGVPLFQRGWGGTEPTARCEPVLRSCTNVLRLVEEAEDEIEAMSGTRPLLINYLRWHQLEAVAAVTRSGSVSAASTRLGITQPAVSRAVSAISSHCRQDLFERRRGGFIATPQADRLAQLRDGVNRELARIKPLLNLHGKGLVGRLAVGMLPFSGQESVAIAFGQLSREHPDLRFVAVPGSYDMLVEALRHGEIDCFVGILRNPVPYRDLVETYLYDEQYTLMARADHPCHDKPPTLTSLSKERWIIAQHGTPARSYFERLFATEGEIPPAQTCEMLSFSSAEKLIIRSDSIALLSYAKSYLANLPDGLRRVALDLPDNRTAIGVTTRVAAQDDEIVQLFISTLREHLP
ncbi:LysR family transcriptional regulator [Sinisalibacter aestuarii]|uniref:HTH lysR-type domain-containing protein n=1 Tax=Sinisalibacter aestuarii TaxID=2949426 RepID=A0ABQ5LY99_9RHOB|nr:LysR family transcriptional regulator [Sinisalibacter aestuarii]GKY89930.1 hypothetical protein STA1M1_37990 [Sinisalibacter aestuarii]